MKNGIDMTIFHACKVSEKSGIPVLFLANPGVGKSTGVEYFARVRNRKLILLRGNTETNESIMGYSVCPPDAKENSSAIQLRPVWFQQLLDNQERGEKSLLFLDEITTANEFTQAALLHLIFERKCGTERIPDDTLIIAAGNYASNLSNSMVMLPPLLSRFMIVNLVPTADDLDDFLNKYDGSLIGKRIDHEKELINLMEEIDRKELDLSPEAADKVGEYIERSIRVTTRMMMTSGNRPIDLKVTELQNIYSDNQNDQPLANFVTLRTLNYYRDVALAEYLCFGKGGLTSDIFYNLTNGLVGLGVSRDSKTGEVKYTPVCDSYFGGMSSVVSDISKMSNNKLPEYVKFFVEMSKKKKFDVSDINTTTNKLRELREDKELSDIARPIESDTLNSLCDLIVQSSSLTNIKLDASKKLSDELSAEEFSEKVTFWNYIADEMTEILKLVRDTNAQYEDDTKNYINAAVEKLRHRAAKLRTTKKVLLTEDETFAKIVPEIKIIKID